MATSDESELHGLHLPEVDADSTGSQEDEPDDTEESTAPRESTEPLAVRRQRSRYPDGERQIVPELSIEAAEHGTMSETSSIVPTSARLSISTTIASHVASGAPRVNEEQASGRSHAHLDTAASIMKVHLGPRTHEDDAVEDLLETLLTNPGWDVAASGAQGQEASHHLHSHDPEKKSLSQIEQLPRDRRHSLYSMRSTAPTLPPYEDYRLPGILDATQPDASASDQRDESAEIAESSLGLYGWLRDFQQRRANNRKGKKGGKIERSNLGEFSSSMEGDVFKPSQEGNEPLNIPELATSSALPDAPTDQPPYPEAPFTPTRRKGKQKASSTRSSRSHSSSSSSASTSSSSSKSNRYNSLSAHYSSIVRHLDSRFTTQLAETRNNIDRAYRAVLAQRTKEVERVKEEAASAVSAAEYQLAETLQNVQTLQEEHRQREHDITESYDAKFVQVETAHAESVKKLEEQHEIEVERARCAVEELWEGRWRDRMALIEAEEVKAARRQRDEEWMAFLQRFAASQDGSEQADVISVARREMLGMDGDEGQDDAHGEDP